MNQIAENFKELTVYQNGMDLSMEIFELTKSFPAEEKYSLVDQVRRSSRSVCANIGEAWRKRRYKKAFISKLNHAETEACETQVWLEFAKKCGYIDEDDLERLNQRYEKVIAQLVKMIKNANQWLIK